MRLTDKIKNLIADGKTLQAVDMLQTFLKEHGSNDNQLLNQTFLLEGQYKDLQKKMQLGLEDAAADLNRINYTLLNLCDEAEVFAGNEEKKAENEEITEGDKTISRTGKILGIVIIVVALVLFGAVYFLNKSEDSTNRGKATETEVLPSLTPKPVSSKNWAAIEPVLNINDRYYGNLKIKISSITSESFDGERDRITLTLNDNCLSSSTGSCMANYLKFRLTIAADNILEPESDKAFAVQSVTTKREETVSFIVPKSANSGMLDIFYVDKPKSKATTKIAR